MGDSGYPTKLTEPQSGCRGDGSSVGKPPEERGAIGHACPPGAASLMRKRAWTTCSRRGPSYQTHRNCTLLGGSVTGRPSGSDLLGRPRPHFRIRHLWGKDEGQNPTGSVKAREELRAMGWLTGRATAVNPANGSTEVLSGLSGTRCPA
jgi:hypothetical protein